MRNVVIIQARMGSTRLPGKVLKMLVDQTVLAHVVKRAQAISGVNEVAVATTIRPEDKVIAEEAQRLGVPVFLGSEEDVLSRYYETAVQTNADVIMRITSDCPLLDPDVSGIVLREFHDAEGADYVSNTIERRFPRGLDTEVFSFAALKTAYMEAKEEYQREHVTPFLYENPQRFFCKSVEGKEDFSQYRWALDTPEDWKLIEQMYQSLYKSGHLFNWQNALALMQERPELAAINVHVQQKSK